MKRIWVIGGVLFFLAVVMWWFVFEHRERRKIAIVTTWTKLEFQWLQNASRTLGTWLETNKGRQDFPEDSIQKEVIPALFDPGDLIKSARLFIYRNQRILFDSGPDFPWVYLNKSIEEIFDSQKKAGAAHYRPLIDGVTSGTAGTGWFIWRTETGRQIAAWTPVRVGDVVWTIGLAVPEMEILRQYDLAGGPDWEMAWAAVVTVLFLGIFFIAFRRERRIGSRLDLLEKTVETGTSRLSAANDQLKIELGQRQQAEEALREIERRLGTLIDTMNEGLVVSDPDGVITFVNDRFARITGHTREELVGRPAGYFLDEFSRKNLIDPGRGSDLSDITPYELGWIGKDGQQIIFLVSPRPILGPQGDYLGAIAALTDITDLKKAENELRKSREDLEEQGRDKTLQLQKINRKLEKEIERRQGMENDRAAGDLLLGLASKAARTGLWDWNPNTDDMFIHPNLKTMLGYEDAELKNQRSVWTGLTHPDDRSKAEQRILSFLKGNTTEYVSEHRMRHKDGSYRWFLAQGTVITDPEGKAVRLVGFETDITERKIIEDGLRHSEEKYRTMLQNMEDGYFETSLSGHLTFINQALCRLLGYGKSEMLGRDHREFLFEETAGITNNLYDQVKLTGAPKKGVFWPMKKRDGTTLRMEASISLLKNQAGEAIGFQVLARDISGYTTVGPGLESGHSFRTWFDHAPDPVFLVTTDTGSIVEANKAGLDLSGRPYAQLTGSGLIRLHPQAESKRYEAIYNLEAKTLENPVSGEVISAQGRVIPVEISRIPVEMDDRTLILVVFRDVSEIKNVETALEENIRAMEQSRQSTGRLLEDIGHELSAPVDRFLNLLDRILTTDLTAEQKDSLIKAKGSGQRLMALVNDLLDHSRIDDGQFEQIRVEFALEDCVFEALLNLASRAREKGLELAMRFRRGVPETVIGDRSRLLRILANLLKNAVKYTDRGQVTVTVDVESQGNRDVILNFSIKDTGIGLPLEKQKEIFSLFTGDQIQNPIQSGTTDLVLGTTARLVRIMGGKIWVVSEPGQGSTFHFTTRFSRSESKDITFTPEGLAEVRNRQVLIVDPNKNTRNLLTEVAADWGLIPIQAASRDQAMEILSLKGDSRTTPDLIIMNTDLKDGPIGSGNHHFPLGMPTIVFISRDRRPVDPLTRENLIYLTKPVKPTDLVMAIKHALKMGAGPQELIRAVGSTQSL